MGENNFTILLSNIDFSIYVDLEKRPMQDLAQASQNKIIFFFKS